MDSRHSLWIKNLDMLARNAGACSWGISDAGSLPSDIHKKMTDWVRQGFHATMTYLERHLDLKKSPDAVLPQCRSVLSFAFPYYHDVPRRQDAPVISRHAFIDDYHSILKRVLQPLASYIKEEFGGKTRICVDSAPLAERYWAVKSGVGSLGKNGLLFVPGYGSWVFLAEILTTAPLPPKKGEANGAPMLAACENCDRCMKACPGSAIHDSLIDSRRCRSYLTIENKQEKLPEDINLHNRIYGCDICQEICPANEVIGKGAQCFKIHSELTNLTFDKIKELDEESFAGLTQGTPMQRIKLYQLKRNAGATSHSPKTT